MKKYKDKIIFNMPDHIINDLKLDDLWKDNSLKSDINDALMKYVKNVRYDSYDIIYAKKYTFEKTKTILDELDLSHIEKYLREKKLNNINNK